MIRVAGNRMKEILESWQELREAVTQLKFERHDIAAHLDACGRYEVVLDEEFPLLIKLFRYSSRHHTRGATWHERLELFMPLDGPACFRMGDEEVRLEPGDLLVVDNLKLHHVVDFPGFDTRVIVISFMPKFIYSLGSPSHDYSFLLPFYTRAPNQTPVLPAASDTAQRIRPPLRRLLERYFVEGSPPFREAGCKAALLEVLFHLARGFLPAELARQDFLRHQDYSLRLKKLFDHINRQPSEKLSVPDAARLAGMSPALFTRTFKKVAGMTLVAYLNHVRLALAAQLLSGTTRSIADIALECGFSDQSYLDRLFKRSFGLAPKDFRREKRGSEVLICPKTKPEVSKNAGGR